jgi:hypothetical protein
MVRCWAFGTSGGDRRRALGLRQGSAADKESSARIAGIGGASSYDRARPKQQSTFNRSRNISYYRTENSQEGPLQQ